MGRVGLNTSIVVHEAVRLADQKGFTQLTMAALARRLSVALPSLYAHVRNLGELRRYIAAVSASELTTRMGEAIQGRIKYEALVALCAAYRHFATTFPGQYAATTILPARADREHKRIAASVAKPLEATLRSYGLEEERLLHATRLLRSTLHGFTSLERDKAFTDSEDLDASFRAMVEALHTTFSAWPTNDA